MLTEPLLFSVGETAHLLSLSERTIWRMIECRVISVIRLGSRTLIPRHEVRRLSGQQ